MRTTAGGRGLFWISLAWVYASGDAWGFVFWRLNFESCFGFVIITHWGRNTFLLMLVPNQITGWSSHHLHDMYDASCVILELMWRLYQIVHTHSDSFFFCWYHSLQRMDLLISSAFQSFDIRYGWWGGRLTGRLLRFQPHDFAIKLWGCLSHISPSSSMSSELSAWSSQFKLRQPFFTSTLSYHTIYTHCHARSVYCRINNKTNLTIFT